MNTLLGNALEAVLHKPADEPYWGALLLTLVSMSLITAATIAGSRLFRMRVVPSGISAGSLALSSVLFVGLVFVSVAPDLSDLMNRFYTHMSYTYEHPSEAWMMLSLPLLRLIGLPLLYILIGRGALVPQQGGRAVPVAA